MLEITKRKNENGYQFTITTEQGKFAISFEGNLDLYWRYVYTGNILEEPSSKSFIITKENYCFYTLLEQLYNDVKDCRIFEVSESNLMFCENIEEVEEKKKEFENWNDDLRKRQEHNSERLFKNNAIEWHCDDFDYDDASIVRIENREDKFIVTLEKSKSKDIFLTYSVRFRNFGSKYTPFNSSFMKMYNSLITYEPDYHQVHIEEYLYQKKLLKKQIFS